MNDTIITEFSKLSDEAIEEIIHLRGKGYGAKRLGKHFGVSATTTSKWLKALGKKDPFKNKVIICKTCGNEHVAKLSTAKYCSNTCRAAYNKIKNKRTQKCQYCNANFKRYEKGTFCTFECSTNQKKKEKSLRGLMSTLENLSDCRHCGKRFFKTTHDKRFCTKRCSQKNLYLRNKEKNKRIRKCEECYEEFMTTDSRMRCCSKSCSNKRNWRNAYLTRRKRVQLNGDVDSDISVEGIMKRDGTDCYLCGEEVDNEVHYTERTYPTIEHVIPISKGGTHTWGNVKLAHRHCNALKSNKILTLTK